MKETNLEKVTLAFAANALFLLLVLSPPFSALPTFAQSGNAGVQLEAGIAKEEVDGDLKAAMDIYQKIAADSSATRDMRAKALLRLAGCYEKLGRQARQLYEQIVRDYGDQPVASQARTRLAILKQQEHPTTPATMTVRKIELSEGMRNVGASDTDGQRVMYLGSDGNLYFGGLAGHTKRLILKAVAGDASNFRASRDFSMVWIGLLPKPNRPARLVVVKADGTGYRELIRDDPQGTTLGERFDASWSWDDRHLLVWNHRGMHLRLVSVSDGQRRELAGANNGYIYKAMFSPDGRFVAYEAAPLPDQAETSRVYVMPLDGRAARQVYESAPRAVQTRAEFWTLCDWTADGQHLVIADAPKGKTGLYLLPVHNGASIGAPILVRYAEVEEAYTAAGGGLIYTSFRPGDQARILLSAFGPDGRLGTWQRLEIRGGGLLRNPWPSFSFDSGVVLYVAQDEDASGGASLVSHDLSNGSERVLYRSGQYLKCQSDVRGPIAFCTEMKGGGRTELVSVSLKSGEVQFLQSFHDPKGLLRNWPVATDQALYVTKIHLLKQTDTGPLVRWDLATHQETTVVESSEVDGFPVAIPSADDRFVIGAGRTELSVRPISGGDWKTLVHANPGGCVASTPDSRFVIYQSTDTAQRQAMFRIPMQGGEPQRIGDAATQEPCNGLWVSPDGRNLLGVRNEVNLDLSLLENFIPSAKQSGGAR